MLSVLHADGDDNGRTFIASHLGARGFRIHSVCGGVACLEALRRIRPDCVILDRELPWGGSDGVLGVIREDPQLQSIPVLLTSASAAAFHDVAAPIIGTLVKPFRIAALIRVLRAFAMPDGGMLGEVTDHVNRRVHGRVRQLKLAIASDGVILTGRTDSFHVKQLAQQAVMESVALPIRTNAIEVD